MQKTKKNRVLRLLSIVLMFTLVSTCLLGGTLAKYVSTANGSDTARVAKWGFDGINAIDIFQTSYLGTLGADETVEASNTDDVVAPGTKGNFAFGFKAGTSEVATKITFAFTETNTANIPIVYEYDSKYYSSVLSGTVYLKLPEAGTFTSVTIDGDLVAMATAIGANTAYAVVLPNANYSSLNGGNISWFWAFEQDATNTTGADIAARDVADTALGTAATAATVTLNCVLTATQID